MDKDVKLQLKRPLIIISSTTITNNTNTINNYDDSNY